MKPGIYNMDCMEAMKGFPDDFFELAIVDPPYGVGSITHGLGRKVKHKAMKWNDAPPPQEYFDQLYRVSKNQIIWGANYYGGMITVPGRIVHNKMRLNENSGPIKWSMCDIASQSFHVRIDMFEYRWTGNVQGHRINFKNDGPDGRIHPTQKPISLYEWCLMKYAKNGDKILDTHLGSGSSAVAADRLGHKLWGYEIDKDYFKAAKKRINEEKKKLTLFK